MDKQELKGKIIGVIESSRLGSVATIKDGKPWVRYMVIHHGENLDCYTTAFASSRKIEQIKKDNNIHLTIGGDPNDFKKSYLNIQAKAQIMDDLETKTKYWSDELKQFFTGPDDPNYVVIKISPEVIEYTAAGTHQPEIYVVGE